MVLERSNNAKMDRTEDILCKKFKTGLACRNKIPIKQVMKVQKMSSRRKRKKPKKKKDIHDGGGSRCSTTIV